jgi:hypothetical protein
MPADLSRVKSRVTAILNLCDAGTFSSAISPRIKNRTPNEIDAIVTDAGLILLRALAETPNEYRSSLINAVTLTHLQLLPEHQGQPAYVEIQRYSGGPWMQGERRDYRKIESYRANTSKIYDPLDHNVNGSSLSGYFDIWEKRLYFTGFAARAGLAQVTRDDVQDKIPEILEPTWIRLSVGESAKAGEGNYSASIAGTYGQKGMNDLQAFQAGARSFPEVSDPEPSSAVHR